MGRTRVFFRAGQISTLQKILNETPAEKGPWIFERLQVALANRQKAKAAAGEAKVLVSFWLCFVAELFCLDGNHQPPSTMLPTNWLKNN